MSSMISRNYLHALCTCRRLDKGRDENLLFLSIHMIENTIVQQGILRGHIKVKSKSYRSVLRRKLIKISCPV